MSLKTPEKVEKLRMALHGKAKEEPEFRFYQLYDKLYRTDVLEFAYRVSRSNKGAAGIDGVTFEQIEIEGVERWLGELTQELKQKTYKADPLKRVWLEKPDGTQRPLGIPSIRDRVVQTAAVLVLGPIFEPDLQPEQYAYRKGRSTHDAVRHVHSLVNTGHTEIVDADLSGYFDTIPHAELMKSLARRISDRHVLALIKQWLVAPVEEIDKRGRRHRTTQAKNEKRGAPQGSPLSPFLSSVYMRRFLLGWKTLGIDQKLNAHIVNFADDFVICCRGTGAQAMSAMRQMMERLKLTVNEQKTGLRYLPEESVDFLGYSIGRCYSTRTGKAYLGTRPSKKSIRKLTVKVSKLTASRRTLLDAEVVVRQLNELLSGWSEYFCLGPVDKSYRVADAHTTHRLRQWLRRKHKVSGSGTKRYPDEYLYESLGLIQLRKKPQNLPWAKA